MNNADFRSLVASTPRQPGNGSSSATPRNASASSLGSKARSSIPMTPRSVKGGVQSDFARQLAEQRAGAQPQKKFRSSAAPKGVKFSGNYVDRARLREESDVQDDKEARIRALEEQTKLGQIDQATFEQLRDQITGGDLSSTHLVKGLDLKLLERIKRGEDVRNRDGAAAESQTPKEDAEDEFDELEAKEVAPVQREEHEKKGSMAPPPLPKPVAGVKRSRNDILAELKASRKAADDAKAAAAQPGKGFHRIGAAAAPQPSSRIETDDKGREFLITVDEHGRTKRKVRKAAAPPAADKPKDRAAEPLKMLGADVVVPEAPPQEEQDEDDDIFQGAGDEYDPLKALGGDDDDSDDNSDDETSASEDEGELSDRPLDAKPSAASTSTPAAPPTKRNYFASSSSSTDAPAPTERASPFKDPAILAALQRASTLAARGGTDADDDDSDGGKGKAPSTAAQRLLGAQRDRDMDDMDLGFGSSRLGDDEEGEEGGERIKLREWKGLGADGDDDGDGDGEKGGRWTKRGGQKKPRRRKKKGDKNSAADVMRVIEGRR